MHSRSLRARFGPRSRATDTSLLTPPPRIGHRRSSRTLRRAPLLLAVAALAVLAGAALALNPRPAEAGHELVWSTTLTPQSVGGGPRGCSQSSAFTARRCEGNLTDRTIELPDGTSITVDTFYIEDTGQGWYLYFGSAGALPAQIGNYAFEVNGFTFRFDDPNIHRPRNDTRQWPGGSAAEDTLQVGTTVEVRLVVAHPRVSISASPTTVDEGGSVTITVRLSNTSLSSRVTIPLVVYGFSAEPGDYSALSGISIRAGETSGTGTITARHDTDSHDDVFGVDLGTLPAVVVRGDPWSVSITIIDDDLPFGVTTVPGSGTGLKILPTDPAVQPVPASRRAPTGAGAGGAFCYTTVGNGTTEYIRYSDGRLVETTKQSEYIRSLYACE